MRPNGETFVDSANTPFKNDHETNEGEISSQTFGYCNATVLASGCIWHAAVCWRANSS